MFNQGPRCCTVMVWCEQSRRRRIGTCANGQRFPRNLGDPDCFLGRIPAGDTGLPTPGLGGALVHRGANSNECNRGTAKRRKRSAAGWASGSRSTLIVPMKPGNWSRRTRWREGKTERGCLMLAPGPGTTSEASYSETRITVTTQDSSPGVRPEVARRIQHQRNRMR